MKVKTTVKEIVQETPKVKLVRLTWPECKSFSFKPGQWVGAWCEDFKGENNKPIRRAFSIASSPNNEYLELCIARGQLLSKHLQDLPAGSDVWIDGPYGMFWLRPSKEYLFIAGGTGIAPFMPMIDEAIRAGAKVTLLFSFKTPSDFIYRERLENTKGLTLVPTITLDEFASWKGRKGRIQTFIEEFYNQSQTIYVCGPPAMVESLENKFASLHHPKDQLFLDKWE